MFTDNYMELANILIVLQSFVPHLYKVFIECAYLYCSMVTFLSVQTTSRRLADRKTAKFHKNITKRGSVPETTVKKGNDYPVGPIVLGFLVIGSCMSSNLLSILLCSIYFTATRDMF